jgi:hypothetical protein
MREEISDFVSDCAFVSDDAIDCVLFSIGFVVVVTSVCGFGCNCVGETAHNVTLGEVSADFMVFSCCELVVCLRLGITVGVGMGAARDERLSRGRDVVFVVSSLTLVNSKDDVRVALGVDDCDWNRNPRLNVSARGLELFRSEAGAVRSDSGGASGGKRVNECRGGFLSLK